MQIYLKKHFNSLFDTKLKKKIIYCLCSIADKIKFNSELLYNCLNKALLLNKSIDLYYFDTKLTNINMNTVTQLVQAVRWEFDLENFVEIRW